MLPRRACDGDELTGYRIQPDVDFRKIEDLPVMVAEMQAGKADKRQVVVF